MEIRIDNKKEFFRRTAEFRERVSGDSRIERCQKFLQLNEWNDYCDDMLDVFFLFRSLSTDLFQLTLFAQNNDIIRYWSSYLEIVDGFLTGKELDFKEFPYSHLIIYIEYLNCRYLAELMTNGKNSAATIEYASKFYKVAALLNEKGEFDNDSELFRFKAGEFLHLFITKSYDDIIYEYENVYKFDIYKYDSAYISIVKTVYILAQIDLGKQELSNLAEVYSRLIPLHFYLWKANDVEDSKVNITLAGLLCVLYNRNQKSEVNCIKELHTQFDVESIVEYLSEKVVHDPNVLTANDSKPSSSIDDGKKGRTLMLKMSKRLDELYHYFRGSKKN